MFVFYDTETTGRSKAFDQIVQFAAILTDDDLNPIEEINVRSRLMPWIIPSLGALRVTGMKVSDLVDQALPSFYQTMKEVHEKLRSWSPATFLGYNTISFDEPFLNQAFWQCLLPPYVTVTDGNSRMDVLPLARAASHFTPNAISLPRNEKGRAVFRLDRLAPHNGFSHDNAHDALADVEATIFVARLIKSGSPNLWNQAVANSSKSATSQKLSTSSPVLVFEHFGKPMPWWGQRLDDDGARGRNGRMADLGRDWSLLDALTDDQLLKWGTKSPKALRNVPLNKAPVIFDVDEAKAFWGAEPTPAHWQNSLRLNKNDQFRSRLLNAHRASDAEWSRGEELEERIYEAFPNFSDEQLMKEFQNSDWRERHRKAFQFEDERYGSLAKRLVFDNVPDILSENERAAIEKAISDRIHASPSHPQKWNTLSNAEADISDESQSWDPDLSSDYKNYLSALRSRYMR